MSFIKKAINAITAVAMAITAVPVINRISEVEVNAAASYPVQEFRFGLSDTDNNVAVNGTSLVPSVMTGKDTEKWSLNFVSNGVYEIVSSDSGKILTASGSGVSLAADTDGANQRWKIEGVQKDFEGYYLYYKITSNADSSKSLTFSETSGFGLEKYNGEGYQKYKINLDGLEGFAANCKVDKGEKAGTIGGLFGKTVTASTADQLEEYLNSTEPLTVVVTANIDMQKKSHTRLRDNKTLVGSYAANTITDSQFRTNDVWGTEGDEPSDNIIFKNIDFQAVNVPDRILVNIWSSRQIWIDHCSFKSKLTYDRKGNGLDEVGKFIWINTPYESYKDAKDMWRSPDYITISYCYFYNRFWTVAYGTQNGEITRCRTTLCFNKWDKNVRRCPQIGNGSAHIYNNFFEGYEGDNGNSLSQIIGGDGCDIVSENCRFQAITKGREIVAGSVEPYRDDGSYRADTASSTPSALNYKPGTQSSWYPGKTNYGYYLIDAYNTKGTDTKDFCNKYSGCFKNESGLKYITDSDLAGFASKKNASPFLKAVDLSVPAVKPATLTNGSVYKIKNKNSGMYLSVDGKATDSANVIQSADETNASMWRVFASPKEGYYYMYSLADDNSSYCLNLKDGSTANGANIEILKQNYKDAQQVMFVANEAGDAYTIRPRSTNNITGIGVSGASKQEGANVVSWALNGSADQEWSLEKISHPGIAMDTSVIYEFENVNSGLVMDVESGKMENGTNVQQWGTGHFKSQQWTLKAFAGGGNYYYIQSAANSNYVLKAENSSNGGNISIAEYSTKDSTMLFKFCKNPDGTYSIMTRASKDVCLVEIANAEIGSGANVQQWAPTDNKCQNWTAETFTTTTVTTTTTTTTSTTAKPITTTVTTTAKPITTAKTETTITITEKPVITTVTTTEIKPTEVLGDINIDGKCEVADVVLLQKWLANKDIITENQLKKADVNKDGKINVFDLMVLKRIVLKVK